jgi:hypothetical protein
MDPALDLEARRLFISTALTMYAARSLRGTITAYSSAEALLALARCLGEEIEPVEQRYSLRFAPSYPGLSAGVESTGGGVRLVFACEVLGTEGHPLGVAFTTLIPGRRPQVSVAPREAGIPDGWRPLDELL